MTLRVNVYLRNMAGSPQSVSTQLLAAIEGFRRHGIAVDVRKVGQSTPCDLAVVWGVRKHREMASGRRVLVLERGYAGDRFAWTSMGYDGLNGYADFRNDAMPGDRWARHLSHLMQPWRGIDGHYVLVCGQVPGDASLRGLDPNAWCEHMARELVAHGLPVRVRRHPKARPDMMPPRRRPAWEEDASATIGEAMAGARWVVTYNSNSSVDAVLAGVPAVTVDRGSMAWDVTGRIVAQPPPMPDRTQWAHNLAYTQWSLAEIERGEAWAHLAPGMDAARAA